MPMDFGIVLMGVSRKDPASLFFEKTHQESLSLLRKRHVFEATRFLEDSEVFRFFGVLKDFTKNDGFHGFRGFRGFRGFHGF